MASFAIVVSSATRIAYLIDTHGANASHIIALTEFARNLIAYGATFFANRSVFSIGVKRTLLAVAAVQAACWLTCIPMYVSGKRVRSFVSVLPFFFFSPCFQFEAVDLELNSILRWTPFDTDRAPSPALLERPVCGP